MISLNALHSSSPGFASPPHTFASPSPPFFTVPHPFTSQSPVSFAPAPSFSASGTPSFATSTDDTDEGDEPDAPALPDAVFKHHRQTITQIENDVEMQPPVSETDELYLLLDTNILLHFFDVLVQFVDDVEKYKVPLVVVVPGVVVRELDSQKNRQDLSWSSRRASTWLLKKIHDKNSAVRGQSLGDTMRQSKNWTVREYNERDNNNDYDILDCWRYFASIGKRTVLLSNDNNLRLAVAVECQGGRVRGEALQPAAYGWSSQAMASKLFPGQEHRHIIDRFGGESKRYTKRKNVKAQPAVQYDEDAMDLDEAPKVRDDWIQPTHALDILHLNVINHFEYLLQMLVDRAAGPNHSIGRDTGSRWQDEGEKRPLSQWLAADCIRWLQRKQSSAFPGGKYDVDRLCNFLSRWHTKGAKGRSGQKWSRGDWDQILALLGQLAKTWEDEAIQESLMILYPEWMYIFSLPMSPTGS